MNKRKITHLMGVLILCNISLFIFTASYYGFNGTYVISEKFEKINPKDNVKLSATHELEWYKTWGGSEGDTGYGIALDGSGNVFIAGTTNSTSAGGSNLLLLKYDSSGNLLWYRTWGGSEGESGRGIALDDSENVFITGISYGNPGIVNVREDVILLKYDSSGNLLWNKTWGGSAKDGANGIAVDGSGNVFITGETKSYGGSFLFKYDSSGNQLWNKTWEGSIYEGGKGVVVDGSGNVFITGSTSSVGAVGYDDVILLKYDSSGNQLWNKTWGGISDEGGKGIALDGSGNAFITGETDSFGAVGYDVILLKYDSSGNLLWNKTWGGSYEDRGYGIALDGSGNAFITGSTGIYGAGDAFLLKYDSSGNQLLNKTWGGSEGESGLGVALDGSGNAFITGYTNSYGAGHGDVFLLKYGVDTDEDGLSDDDEVKTYFTDPNNSDTDGDGLSDGDEVKTYFTDPNDSDTDGDGLSDGDEVRTYFTDPNDSDTDGDGLNDGEEIALGYDPNNPLSNSYIIPLIITILIVIISIISLVIVGKKVKKKRKESFNDALISEIEAKIKEGEKFKVKGELERVHNICNEQLLSSEKLYDSLNKEQTIIKIKNLIDDTIGLKIEENIKEGEQLNNEGDFINAIKLFKELLENTKSISETSKREDLREKIREYLKHPQILKIKSIIIDLAFEYPRLEVMDILEKCGEDEELIIFTIQNMIKNREISAEYFKNSKAVAFSQQIDVEEIDKLMKSFDEWEKEGKGKKK